MLSLIFPFYAPKSLTTDSQIAILRSISRALIHDKKHFLSHLFPAAPLPIWGGIVLTQKRMIFYARLTAPCVVKE